MPKTQIDKDLDVYQQIDTLKRQLSILQTREKLPTEYALPVVAVDNATDNFNPGDAADHAIPGWSVNFTVPAGTPDVRILIGCEASFNTQYGASVKIYRDAGSLITYVSGIRFNQTPTTTVRIGYSWEYIDTAVAAGTYSYAVYLAASGSVNPNVDILSKYIEVQLCNF